MPDNKSYRRYRTNIIRSPQQLFTCIEDNGNEIKSIYITNLHDTTNKEVSLVLTDVKLVAHYICYKIGVPPKDVLILETPFNMEKGDTLDFECANPTLIDITISY